jgi:hypothetical protein
MTDRNSNGSDTTSRKNIKTPATKKKEVSKKITPEIAKEKIDVIKKEANKTPIKIPTKKEFTSKLPTKEKKAISESLQELA